MIIQVFSNSMIFPCMELFLVIFQVFRDFQSLWEPCHFMLSVLHVDYWPALYDGIPCHAEKSTPLSLILI